LREAAQTQVFPFGTVRARLVGMTLVMKGSGLRTEHRSRFALPMVRIRASALPGAGRMAGIGGYDRKMQRDKSSADIFEHVLARAIDDLPEVFQKVLADVPIVVSDLGTSERAYGQYQGDTVARDNYPDRIIIFRDTLMRDFGHDPDLLVAQVRRTLYHEFAHHLGWGEEGVAKLGL
jgi:predicted Zn-dependent protease with MMP-like domain